MASPFTADIIDLRQRRAARDYATALAEQSSDGIVHLPLRHMSPERPPQQADALDLAADAEREAIREDNDRVLDWSRALRPRVPSFPLHHYQLLDPNRASFAEQLKERAAANLEREVAFIVNLLGALTLALGIAAMVAL